MATPTLATLLHMPGADDGTPRRPRGRPRDDSPATRARHLRCYFDAEVRGHSFAECARLHGVGKTTAYRWINLARTYPEAAALAGDG
jgi:transposase-like protein